MDIDIDVTKNFKPEQIFKIVRASNIVDNELKPHASGVYFQNMQKDPITNLAAIPYDESEEFGYTKFDFLHLDMLSVFKSKEQMRELLEKEPNWKLLEDRNFVENNKLFQLAKQFNVLYKVKPKSIVELADVLMLIRSNKIVLIDKYIRNKKAVRPELYTRRVAKDLRRSHAVAYALLVVLHMHALEQNYTYEPFE